MAHVEEGGLCDRRGHRAAADTEHCSENGHSCNDTDPLGKSNENLHVNEYQTEVDKGSNQTDPEDKQEPEETYGFSLSGGIAAALRSISSTEILSLGQALFPVLGMFSVPKEENASVEISSSSSHERDAESRDLPQAGENTPHGEAIKVNFESKFIHGLPLYQEYWLKSLKSDLNRVNQRGLSDLVVSQCLPGLQSPPGISSKAAALTTSPGLQGAACTLWQELPEVQTQGLLHTLTVREIQHQEAMFELMVSEASYLKSLGVAVRHFQESTELRQTLSALEHRVLFSNLKNVAKVSERFLSDLESQVEENVVMSQVGDITLRHHSAFQRVYVPYVTNMMYQEALVSRLWHGNKRFASAVRELEKDPECQRQSLKSFLVLPFQRITRLRLILENILKRTDAGSSAVPVLRDAIEAVRQIVSECDARVLQMKQMEELVRLEKRVDFGNAKAIPMLVRGRRLVHEGPLRQLTVESTHNFGSSPTFTEVYVHLFSDLLLLSLRREEQFIVQEYAQFPDHVRIEDFKMELLGLPPEAFLIHLTKNHRGSPTAIVLATNTRLERETWLQALSSKKGKMITQDP